jgi:hemerythrin
MNAIPTPTQAILDEAEIKLLYPQLFTELDALAQSADADFAASFSGFVAKLERDFALEEQWLQHLDVHAQRTHRAEHAQLLGLLHHAQARMHEGDCRLGQKIIPLLSPWFIHHISMMDTAWANAASRHALRQAPAMLDAA